MHEEPGTVGLIDVADLSLEDLRHLDSAPLRRVLACLFEEDVEPVAGFDSAV